jgi:hypothetical protein
MKKVVKMKIGDKIIEETVKKEKDGVLYTKHYTIKNNCGKFYCEDEKDFVGATVIQKSLIKRMFG